MKTLDQESDWGGAAAVERKLIRNVSLEVETENFDELLLAVKERTFLGIGNFLHCSLCRSAVI